MLAWEQDEWSDRYADPVSGIYQHVTENVKAAMVDLGADRDRLESVCVTSTLQETVSAMVQSFPDGSALAKISDSIMSLANVYTGYSADLFKEISSGGPRGIWRIARSMRGGAFGGDVDMLTGLLRYYNVNQRVFGVPAKLGLLLRPESEAVEAFLLLQSMRFVIGHEIAHHVLGHGSVAHAFSPQDELPTCSPDQQRELDADMFALRATQRAAERDAGAPAAHVEAATALGALVGMLVVNVTEQALFLRRGASHPPASTRAALLLGRLGGPAQTLARLFLGDLLAATRASATFEPGARVFDASQMIAHRRVGFLQSEDYLRLVSMLDTAQCREDEALTRFLHRTGSDLAEGAQAALDGDPGAALSAWGLERSRTEEICDSRRVLVFHGLLESLRESFAGRFPSEEETLLTSLVAAQLVARRLSA